MTTDHDSDLDRDDAPAPRPPSRRAPRAATAATPPAGRAGAFARAVADRSPWLLPLVVVAGAAVLGALRGASAAILTLAGGTLLGVIILLWRSLQVLVGEAPLSLEAALDLSASGGANEQKQAILRALKDLEYERGLGKLSDDDYRELAARYRAEAKALLRSIDDNLGPARQRAERLIEGHLGPKPSDKPKKKKKRAEAAEAADAIAAAPAGVAAAAAPADVDAPLIATAADGEPAGDRAPVRPAPLEAPALAVDDAAPAPPSARPAALGAETAPLAETATIAASAANAPSCPVCATRNDVDASFCKACGSRLGASAAPAAAPSEP